MKGMTMTNNNVLKECNEAYSQLKEKCDLVKAELDILETDVESVASPLNTEAIDTRTIKQEFGEMFTGCLTPVNGHNIKDRRYFDEEGNPTSDFDEGTRESVAVWKGIGRKRSFRKNTTWYQSHQIFDKLKQEHVNLIHNGKYSRRDHQEVAQDFLDTRNKINNIEGTLKDTSIQCVPASPLPIALYFVDDGYSSRNVVTDMFTANIISWNVGHRGIQLEIDPSDELQGWKNFQEVEPVIDFGSPEPKSRMGYGNSFYMDGLVPVFVNQDTIDAKQKLDKIGTGMVDEMDSLKNKYANRLVVKGVF
tara:strand:- start:1218 stop:2135 length:918 start_codon:yes stop_codon:yes gene_type:complete